MAIFNRVVAALLWLIVLGVLAVFAVVPLTTVAQAQTTLTALAESVRLNASAQSRNDSAFSSMSERSVPLGGLSSTVTMNRPLLRDSAKLDIKPPCVENGRRPWGPV